MFWPLRQTWLLKGWNHLCYNLKSVCKNFKVIYFYITGLISSSCCLVTKWTMILLVSKLSEQQQQCRSCPHWMRNRCRQIETCPHSLNTKTGSRTDHKRDSRTHGTHKKIRKARYSLVFGVFKSLRDRKIKDKKTKPVSKRWQLLVVNGIHLTFLSRVFCFGFKNIFIP